MVSGFVLATTLISEFSAPQEHLDLLRQFLRGAAEEQEFLRAYLECSDEVQQAVRDMFRVLEEPLTSEEQRQMALSTIADALFRNPHKGEYGMDVAESEAEAAAVEPRLQGIVKQMDEEEASFAQRLRKLMEERCITQEELAERIGVGQPAVSNMLNRNCRPQKKTIMKLATALNVSSTVLWPGVEVQRILDAIDRVQEDQVMSATEAEALQAALDRPPSRIEVTRIPVRNRC
jgi:transcriptional regulator with XRE-family HTH domain